MSRNGRAVGRPEDLDADLFTRMAQTGQLHVQRCDRCGTHSHPPRWFCPACSSAEQTFVPSSGEGVVHSWTVSHTAAEPVWRDQVPYTTVVVELAEGVRVVGSAPAIGGDAVDFGLPVRVVVEPEGDAFAFLRVDPVEEGRS